MSQYQAGTLEAEYWNVLKTHFIPNAPDAYYQKWGDAPHLFRNNKSCFGYNMNKIKDIWTPITQLNAQYNNQKSAKQISAASQRLQDHLYLCHGVYVMLT